MLPEKRKQTSTELMLRLLDDPQLATQIQHLAPSDLHRLVLHVGLEDAAPLLDMVTTTQLFQLFDLDLWRSERPGKEEQFDAQRFGLWLEILRELGTVEAAQKIAAMDPAFVVMALASQVVVFPTYSHRILFPDGDEDDDVILEKLIESRLYHEFDSHLVLSKQERAWDALLDVLIELESCHHDFFTKILNHLARLSQDDYHDMHGLAQLLSLSDQLSSDMAEERDQRRQSAGFVTPVQAAQFIEQARRHSPGDWLTRPLDPDTLAYFERLADADLRRTTSRPGKSLSVLLGKTRNREHLLLAESDSAGVLPVHRALAALSQNDPQLHALRLRELTYLSNILIAGCDYQGRAFRPVEAAQCAVAACNLGLEQWLAFQKTPAPSEPEDPLILSNLVTLFCMGWSVLHQQVSLATAQRLIDILAMPPRVPGKVKDKTWIEQELQQLKRDLENGMEKQMPWLHADQILILDTLMESELVTKLTFLLGETPLWVDSLPKTSQPQPSSFIATLATVQDIRHYLAGLSEQFT